MADGRLMGRWTREELEREVIRLQALLAEQMRAAPDTGDTVTVAGIVGMSSGEPIVTMRAGEASWQFTTAQARQHALIVLDAAVEAERDAATVAFLTEILDMDSGRVAGFLTSMRDHRANWLDEMRSGAHG